LNSTDQSIDGTIKSTIENDEIFNVLLEFSEKFNQSMKILNSFGRFHELKSELRIYSEASLYEIFCETVTEDVIHYMGDLKTTDSPTNPQEICESLKKIKFEEDLSLLAFESILVGSGGRKNQTRDILELCDILEQSKVPLPLEIIKLKLEDLDRSNQIGPSNISF
jgi:hypothetical protein